MTANLHGVTDRHRAFKGQQQTGDEIIDHVLQAKANAHAQGATDNREIGELETHRRRRKEQRHRDNRIPDQRRHGDRGPGA